MKLCAHEFSKYFQSSHSHWNNLIIEKGTLIAMSASLIKNTEEYTVYMGVPAKPKGRSNEEKIAMSL